MKRDWDLIRTILLKIQDDDHTDLDGYDRRVVAEHQRLLKEAGLIEGRAMEGGSMPWQTCRLTWQGHEFIESAQNERVYKGVVEKASKVGAISFEIIKTMLAEAATRAMLGPG